MKKTLIALAAVAATGAAFAQSTVTLSGKLAFGYEDSTTITDEKSKGLGVTDGDFVMTASEDLGGGLKATASMAVQSRGRGTDIAGRDASLTLSGGFGSVMIGAIEAGNGILGLGGAGAPVIGLDNGKYDALENIGVLDAASNVDILKYTSPSMGGFAFSVNMTDAPKKGGSQSGATTQDSYGLGVTYSAGPLAVSADYTSYGKNSAATQLVDGALVLVDDITADSRTRISASYDLGVAKLGVGYQVRDWNSTAGLAGKLGDNTQYLLGVSVPMGAFSFGYNYGSHEQKIGTEKVTAKGHDLGMHYALSKRTGVRVAYQVFEVKAAGTQVGVDAKRAQIRLMHTF